MALGQSPPLTPAQRRRERARHRQRRAAFRVEGLNSDGKELRRGPPEEYTGPTLAEVIDQITESMVDEAMRRNNRNIARCARELGVSPKRFYVLLEKHGWTRGQWKKPNDSAGE